MWASSDYARLASACESDAGAEQPSATCDAFLKGSEKAAQQWELEKRFGLVFEDNEEMDTIGGWIQYQKGTTAQDGDEIQHGEHIWAVAETDNFQIKHVILRHG